MLNWIFPRGVRLEQRIYPLRDNIPIVGRREDGTLCQELIGSRSMLSPGNYTRDHSLFCESIGATLRRGLRTVANGTAWRRRNVAKELQVYLVGRDDSTKRVTVLRPN
jgi:hypothetical protein